MNGNSYSKIHYLKYYNNLTIYYYQLFFPLTGEIFYDLKKKCN